MMSADEAAFGALLRRYRLAAGLSQEALAERAQISAREISDLERGARRRPRPATLQLLIAALDLQGAGRLALEDAAQRRDRSAATHEIAAGAGGMLAIPASPLVGRERDAAQVVALLGQRATRLLTLTGAPGVGKTRLALEVAAMQRRYYDHGVFLVELAPLSDHRVVITAIAQALGVRETGGQILWDVLRGFLRDKHVLLLLDNFEHVTEAAPVLGELLSAAPRLTLLVTSRVPLHVRAEQQYPVAPLAYPPAGDPDLAVGAWERYSALAFFVQSARRLNPEFALDARAADAVAEICRRLDGLPLAIELAVAWIKLLPPPALLERLQPALSLLTGGAQDLPARQRTMRDTLQWSYQLLTDDERILFRQLAVFAGSASLDAVEAICAPDADTRVTLLSRLNSLVDKNLVRQQETPVGSGTEVRVSMLETVRGYAWEQLQARDEQQDLQRRHCHWCLSLALPPEGTWATRWEAARLELLQRELDNLRAALAWQPTAPADAEAVLRLAEGLCELWEAQGYLSEGVRWLDAALARAPGAPPHLRAGALLGAGRLASVGGNQAAGTAYFQACEELYRQAGDRDGLARAFNLRGSMALLRGDFAEAMREEQKSLTLFQELDDPQGMAVAQQDLGNATALDAILNQHADPRAQWALLAEALRLIDQSVSLHRQLGNRQDSAFALFHKGVAAFYLGRNEQLAATQTAAPGEQVQLAAMARAHVADAIAAVRDSLELHVQIGNQTGLAMSLDGMAVAAGALGQPRIAAQLFAFVDALRSRINVPRQSSYQVLYLEQIAALRAGLGEQEFEAAMVEGRALSQQTIVAAALALPVP